MKNIMIITGEASGDLHGANLVHSLRKKSPHNLHFCGMGSSALQQAGVELLCDAAEIAVVGLVEVLAHLGEIRSARQKILQRLRQKSIDLLILIDLPDFNFMLAKEAHRLNIPVFYYISPQIWAWRTGRVKFIAKYVQKMAVILPFEQDFYRQHGVEVDFVGHPLLDAVPQHFDKKAFWNRSALPQAETIIGILPGSRKGEIKKILPHFLEAARRIATIIENPLFLLPLAPTLNQDDLSTILVQYDDLPLKVIDGDRYELMAACDAVMAASGTVTLELAILNVPMVVAYRISPLTYALGRRLIKVKFASLINIIADREIVPELLQDHFTPENVADQVIKLLPATPAHKRMKRELREVVEKLGGPGASDRAASLALEMLGI